MSTKLTDMQRDMLSAAAMREDKCVVLPTSLRGAQIRKTCEKLIGAGFVREVKAKPSSPIWRRDDETGSSYALKLTAAGAKAVKAADEAAGEASRQSAPAGGGPDGGSSDFGASPAVAPDRRREIDAASSPPPLDKTRGAPRNGSKIAEVVSLLERDIGATISELIAATQWLPHTTRAALTGLRKRGYAIVMDQSDRERGSVYRIGSGPPAGKFGSSASAAEASQ